jgi:transporter family protein
VDRLFTNWPFWAVLSAVFAAATAIFAKIGISGVNSNLATLIRTGVILVAGAVFVAATDSWQSPSELSRKTWLFLVLSGLATGASWFCYFHALKLGDAARVAPVDKLSVVFVAVIATAFLGEKLSLANWLGVALIAGGSILVAWRA